MTPDPSGRARLLRPHISAHTVGVLLICAVVLTAGAVFYIWQRYQFISLGFEVNELRREKAGLEAQIEPLEVEKAYLSRPGPLEKAARKMGLREPQPEQVIKVITDVPAAPID